jgi:hypothetical protein
MRSLFRRVAASAVLLLLGACSGGGSAQAPPAGPPLVPGTPQPTATPSPRPAPVPDSVARDAVQGALLAESAVLVAAPVTGGPRLLAARRTTSRTPRSTVACTNGYSEQDTTTAQTTHVVVSLYTDAACTTLRQRATFDDAMGVDTSTSTGTIVSYDAAGHVTATQSANDFFFASGGGYIRRQSTDTAGTASAPFGHSEIVCLAATQQCTFAAVTDGAAFETGVLLTATVPAIVIAPSATVTIPFNGSVRFGAPGAITIVDGQPLTAPTLAGGGTPVTFTGTLAATLTASGPATFTLTLDAATTHVDGTFSNGTTTFTIADGTTATVNANGDGLIRYASGATEAIVDFRISG